MNLDRRLLEQAKTVRLFLALTLGAGLAVGVLTVAQAGLVSQTINLVFLEGQSLSGVQALLIGLLIVIVTRAAFSWAGEVAAFQAAGRIKMALRQRVFDHLLALGPAYVRGERTGELSNTIVEGVEALEAYFSQYLPQLILAALVPLTVLAFVFPIDVLSGVVLLLTGPLIPFFMILIGKAAEALTRRQWASLSLLSAHFLDVMQGLATLKMLGRSRQQAETIAQVSDRFRDTTMGVLRVAFLSAFALEMIATLSTAVVSVEIGLRLLYGNLLFEQALFILILAPEFYLPLRLLGTRFHAGMSGVTAARRIFEILETPLPRRAPVQLSADFSSDLRQRAAQGIIRFEDVHYAFEDGQRPALRGASFEIAAGRQTALVGPTGAGKSTVAHLLLRFIDAKGGQIGVDGMSLRDIPVKAWREQIAWVPQNPYLFNESVAANMLRARSDASFDDVKRAARQAHAHEFVMQLAQGYDTIIGERGARLSGGQAQRIALARAFLKNAPILILDEATSNLDAEIEDLIREAVESLMQGRTTLMIAHRLNTIARAHRIVVLNEGRIEEDGTHSELMERRRFYHRLITAGQGMKDEG